MSAIWFNVDGTEAAICSRCGYDLGPVSYECDCDQDEMTQWQIDDIIKYIRDHWYEN